ncbi:MAG: hypothetical protein P8103_07505 [Candidatus Thiodiazotropha sp.]
MSDKNQLALRKYPYPYRALLAICSDLDETPNEQIYFETIRYLNTDQQTVLGRGVNLEIGNTIYFHMPKDQFSYWNCSDNARSNIHALIRSGHIDCIHSFGDYADTRDMALACLQELDTHGCKIKVWVDHAQAPTNFDPDIMQGQGAVKGANAYHADITVGEYGIKYVWKGRVTSIIAQNSKRSFRGILNKNEITSSLKTILREFAKGLLAVLGNEKYAMHKHNDVMRETKLVDGTRVIEFMRTNPSWAGVSKFEKGREIGKVLTEEMLKSLVRNEGCSVLYTHLGKINSLSEPFNKSSRAAFENLSNMQEDGQILVITTRRLLDYIRVRDRLVYSVKHNKTRTEIHIGDIASELESLEGITWYVEDPDTVDIFVSGKMLNHVIRNEPDFTGNRSISIPLERLQFPQLN